MTELIGPGGKTEWPLPLSSAPRPTPLFRVVLMETKRAPEGACERRIPEPEDAEGRPVVAAEPAAARSDAAGSEQVWTQPALDALDGLALTGRVVVELVAPDPADREVARGRVREVDPAHRRRRRHRERLRQVDPDRVRPEQPEELLLLAVVGAGGVAERGTDAAKALRDEVAGRERLVRRVPLAPCLRVQPLRERLGEPVGERLDDDRAVVVVLRCVPCGELVGALDRDRERTGVVVLAGDVVGE